MLQILMTLLQTDIGKTEGAWAHLLQALEGLLADAEQLAGSIHNTAELSERVSKARCLSALQHLHRTKIHFPMLKCDCMICQERWKICRPCRDLGSRCCGQKRTPSCAHQKT